MLPIHLAIGVNFVDTSHRIESDTALAIVTDKDADGLEIIRHSTAHLLAFDSVQGRWRLTAYAASGPGLIASASTVVNDRLLASSRHLS